MPRSTRCTSSRTARWLALIGMLAAVPGVRAEIRTLVATGAPVSYFDLEPRPAGGFSIAWFPRVAPFLLQLQRFDVNGSPSGPVLEVAEAESDYPGLVCLASDSAGNELVLWVTNSGGADFVHRLFASAFDSAGHRLFPIVEIARTTRYHESLDSFDCVESSGAWLVAWSDHASVGEASHIFAQRIAPGSGPVGTPSRVMERSTFFFGDVQVTSGVATDLVAWTSSDSFLLWPQDLEGRLIDKNCAPAAAERVLVPYSLPEGNLLGYRLIEAPGDISFLVYGRHLLGASESHFYGTKVEGDAPWAQPWLLGSADVALYGGMGILSAAADELGHTLLSWTGPGTAPSGGYSTFRQGFLLWGAPLTNSRELATLLPGLDQQGRAIVGSFGRWVVAWQRRPTTGSDFGIDAELGRFAPDCVPSSTALCLSGGRFLVRSTFHDHLGRSGEGQAVALTPESGTFWFFTAANVELIVKIVDACGHPDFRDFWVYASGLTDVEVTLTVADTWTGDIWERSTDLGEPFPPVLDSQAFHTCDATPLVGPDAR